jgi:hypothetical protein
MDKPCKECGRNHALEELDEWLRAAVVKYNKCPKTIDKCYAEEPAPDCERYMPVDRFMCSRCLIYTICSVPTCEREITNRATMACHVHDMQCRNTACHKKYIYDQSLRDTYLCPRCNLSVLRCKKCEKLCKLLDPAFHNCIPCTYQNLPNNMDSMISFWLGDKHRLYFIGDDPVVDIGQGFYYVTLFHLYHIRYRLGQVATPTDPDDLYSLIVRITALPKDLVFKIVKLLHEPSRIPLKKFKDFELTISMRRP